MDNAKLIAELLREIDAVLLYPLNDPQSWPSVRVMKLLQGCRAALSAQSEPVAMCPYSMMIGGRQVYCAFKAGMLHECYFSRIVEPAAHPVASAQSDPIISAQHDETGRMWEGPRSQIPRRYFECAAPLSAQVPPYPTGNVNGPCVCGSWPGGPCFRCPRIAEPAAHPVASAQVPEVTPAMRKAGARALGVCTNDKERIAAAVFTAMCEVAEP